jgi:hypothetical protein
MFICMLMIGFIGCFVWSIFQAAAVARVQLRRMHQVPCDRCIYFTNSSHLKCTVHPCKALTENAIDCRDFEVQRVPRQRVWEDTWAVMAKHDYLPAKAIIETETPIDWLASRDFSDYGVSK